MSPDILNVLSSPVLIVVGGILVLGGFIAKDCTAGCRRLLLLAGLLILLREAIYLCSVLPVLPAGWARTIGRLLLLRSVLGGIVIGLLLAMFITGVHRAPKAEQEGAS